MPSVHAVVKPCPWVKPDPEEWIGWDFRFTPYERVIYRLSQLTPAELERVWVEVAERLGKSLEATARKETHAGI